LHSVTSTRLQTYYIPFHEHTYDIICETIKVLGKVNPNRLNLDITVSFTGDLQAGIHKTEYISRMYFYIESSLKEKELESLHKICISKGIFITLRGAEYLKIKMKIEQAKAFISHDSKDKDFIAKKIAKGLSSRLCPVWYDEYSLKIGDSLRESIERGIKEAHKCVLIVTPNYLNNLGWGKTEFNSIFTRELIKKEKVVLPIWFGVTVEEVYEYCPSLADTFALTWPSNENKTEIEYDQEVEQLISQIHTAVTVEFS
jgi:hypothetical protein